MVDKRTAKRIQVDHPVPLTIEQERVSGTLVNLSDVGALFEFDGDDQHAIDRAVLGLDGSFTIKPKGHPARRYTGELVRYYVHNGRSFLALRFWSRYQEVN